MHRDFRHVAAGAPALAVVLMLSVPRSVGAADFVVNSAGDANDAMPNGICETGNGNGECTLRAAFMEADNRPGLATTIEIASSVPVIDLSLGEILVDENVSLVGQGALATRIRRFAGSPQSRFLEQTSGELRLQRLTVSGFSVATSSPGAIWAQGDLSVEDSILESNQGGAIRSQGHLEIQRTAFAFNASDYGGSIEKQGGTFLIVDTIFEAESADFSGGALYADGTSGSIVSSLFVDGHARWGGAIAVLESSVRILNSTFSGNRANADGGALFVRDPNNLDRPVHVLNSTLVDNRANEDQDATGGQGGALFTEPGETVSLSNSILADNGEWIFSPEAGGYVLRGVECHGAVSSNGFNIVRGIDPFECSISGGTISVDPQLEALVYNGGFTRTFALSPTSPAIDAGKPSGCVDDLAFPIPVDQRGATRHFGQACDLGAFEYGSLVFEDGFDDFGTGRWSSSVSP